MYGTSACGEEVFILSQSHSSILAVLMRLKVDLFIQDIADRFQISRGSFPMNFTTGIT